MHPPVVVGVPGQLLEKRDVGQERSAQDLPLLRGQPRPGRLAALVELTDERPARHPPGVRREELPRRGAGADHRTEHPGPHAVVHERPGVARRDLGDHVLRDAEKPAHPVQRRTRVVDQLPVAEQRAPAPAGSARRGPRAAGRTSRARGSARTAPSRRRPAARSSSHASTTSAARLQPVGPQVHPVGVGAVHRVPEHGDQLGPGRSATIRRRASRW